MRTIAFGAALLVLAACSQSPTSPAPIHQHLAPKASIICPPGYSGVVIRTGFEEQEVCMPSGQF